MTSRIREPEEYELCVRGKSTGLQSDGYIHAMYHEVNTAKRGLLTCVPTTLDGIRIMNNGLPQVKKNDLHLMQNLQESIDPSPKSPAMMIAMKQLIKEGRIKRIPAIVRKENDTIPDRVGYHKAYLYVDARCECPTWWVRGLDEVGELKRLSYKNFSRRFSGSTIRIVEPDHSERSLSLTAKCLAVLPERPTPDISIDPWNTPGTSHWILKQLPIESTSYNRRKIGATLRNCATRGKIGQIVKRDNRGVQGKNLVTVFYKNQ